MELVQGQIHEGHRVHFPCGICGAVTSVTKSYYATRKRNSKSGNLFCSPRCNGISRRNQNNKKEESALEELEAYFANAKKKEWIVVNGVRLGEGGANPPNQFFSGDGELHYITALREQETKMAEERLTWEELQAKYGELGDKMEFVINPDTGTVGMEINNTPDSAVPIDTPTAPPPQVASPAFTPGAGLRLGGGNNRRRGGRWAWEYEQNASMLLIECDAGNHNIPEEFLQTIPEKTIWASIDGERKPQPGPYPKCALVTDDFGVTSREFINIVGLAQFLNPNAYPNTERETNHGQYLAGGVCNRCQGKNHLGDVVSNGMMTTRNLAFNFTFDKQNGIVPSDYPWENYLQIRGLKLLEPGGNLAAPIKDPFTS